MPWYSPSAITNKLAALVEANKRATIARPDGYTSPLKGGVPKAVQIRKDGSGATRHRYNPSVITATLPFSFGESLTILCRHYLSVRERTLCMWGSACKRLHAGRARDHAPYTTARIRYDLGGRHLRRRGDDSSDAIADFCFEVILLPLTSFWGNFRLA